MVLTTADEVRVTGQIAGDYTDEEINAEIDIVEAEVYNKYNLPKRSQFSVDDDYTNFYIYPKEVHEIIRLQVAVQTDVDPSGYLTLSSGSDYTFTADNNYLTLTGSALSLYDGKLMRVQQNPRIFNLIATTQCALNLIESTSIIDGERVDSPKTIQLKSRLKRYKHLLFNGLRFQKSTVNEEYDKYSYVSYSQSELR